MTSPFAWLSGRIIPRLHPVVGMMETSYTSVMLIVEKLG